MNDKSIEHVRCPNHETNERYMPMFVDNKILAIKCRVCHKRFTRDKHEVINQLELR